MPESDPSASPCVSSPEPAKVHDAVFDKDSKDSQIHVVGEPGVSSSPPAEPGTPEQVAVLGADPSGDAASSCSSPDSPRAADAFPDMTPDEESVVGVETIVSRTPIQTPDLGAEKPAVAEAARQPAVAGKAEAQAAEARQQQEWKDKVAAQQQRAEAHVEKPVPNGVGSLPHQREAERNCRVVNSGTPSDESGNSASPDESAASSSSESYSSSSSGDSSSSSGSGSSSSESYSSSTSASDSSEFRSSSDSAGNASGNAAAGGAFGAGDWKNNDWHTNSDWNNSKSTAATDDWADSKKDSWKADSWKSSDDKKADSWNTTKASASDDWNDGGGWSGKKDSWNKTSSSDGWGESKGSASKGGWGDQGEDAWEAEKRAKEAGDDDWYKSRMKNRKKDKPKKESYGDWNEDGGAGAEKEEAADSGSDSEPEENYMGANKVKSLDSEPAANQDAASQILPVTDAAILKKDEVEVVIRMRKETPIKLLPQDEQPAAYSSMIPFETEEYEAPRKVTKPLACQSFQALAKYGLPDFCLGEQALGNFENLLAIQKYSIPFVFGMLSESLSSSTSLSGERSEDVFTTLSESEKADAREMRNTEQGGRGRPALSYLATLFREHVVRKSLADEGRAWLPGFDVIGIAKTGSGKTLSYLVPAVIHVLGAEARRITEENAAGKSYTTHEKNKGYWPLNDQALVIAPVRELADQVSKVADQLLCWKQSKCYSTPIFGGMKNKVMQIQDMTSSHIWVACPGRLMDIAMNGASDKWGTSSYVSFRNVTFVVLDEADRMLDMGFENDVRAIVNQCGAEGTLSPDDSGGWDSDSDDDCWEQEQQGDGDGAERGNWGSWNADADWKTSKTKKSKKKKKSDKRPRCTMFYSATWPSHVKELADSFCQRSQVIVSCGQSMQDLRGSAGGDATGDISCTAPDTSDGFDMDLVSRESIDQRVVVFDEEFLTEPEKELGGGGWQAVKTAKRALLNDYLAAILPDPTNKILIFVESRAMCDELIEQITADGYEDVEALHGGKQQGVRLRALDRFRSGHTRVMVSLCLAFTVLGTAGNFKTASSIAESTHRSL